MPQTCVVDSRGASGAFGTSDAEIVIAMRNATLRPNYFSGLALRDARLRGLLRVRS
jgi:hypothetical protein